MHVSKMKIRIALLTVRKASFSLVPFNFGNGLYKVKFLEKHSKGRLDVILSEGNWVN